MEKEKTMRPIDADALKQFEMTIKRGDVYSEVVYAGYIHMAPTLDVAPVVRCKYCKWWTKQEASMQGRCEAYGMYPTGEWYCARGERKANE